MELEDGLTEDLEQRHATLLLTNRRLIRYSAGGHRNNVVSVGVSDVDSIEVRRTERNRQWVWVGLVFIGGGLTLVLLSVLFLSSPLSPLLMALSLTFIGVVFLLTFFGGLTGEVMVKAGLSNIKCRMKPKALEDMVLFVERFYELKLGYAGDALGVGEGIGAGGDTD